ncbi:MAG: hypothetical protein JXR90_13755 [Spirochaetes bacterium]|nr:hypothetical protein [Spirochaetota bacterium]
MDEDDEGINRYNDSDEDEDYTVYLDANDDCDDEGNLFEKDDETDDENNDKNEDEIIALASFEKAAILWSFVWMRGQPKIILFLFLMMILFLMENHLIRKKVG